ncbi:MAG: hypothetical protein JWO33_470 [Caulobacteraceae bacterium]|nr:hypothetical protein [Caulobacteraceae bacterium]
MAHHPVLTGLKRGVALRCPECGQGRLLRGYLKVQPICEVCGHDNAQYPSDDAPPYFTILLVGHLIVAPVLIFPFIWTWPVQWVLLATLPALAAITLMLLPRVKGAVIGLQWALRGVDGRPSGQPEDRTWRRGA